MRVTLEPAIFLAGTIGVSFREAGTQVQSVRL